MAKLNLKGNRGGKPKGGGSKSSLRDKFKKRKQDVLETAYEKREEQSKAGSAGQSIFNEEMLEKYDLVAISKPDWGDFYAEIMPVSYDEEVPYFLELPVHGGVGLSNDNFICMQRWPKGKNKRCFRCEVQSTKFRALGDKKITDEIKALYPSDRVIYLFWDRTDEMANEEDQTYQLKVWASPKKGVHAKIQAKVRDKRTKQILDISDVSEDGDGRTVYISVDKKEKGKWPEYNDFELIQRDDPIPDEILEQLDEFITDAEKAGFAHPLEMLLHIPEYDEVKESMATEGDDDDPNDEDDNEESSGRSSSGSGKQAQAVDEDELNNQLEKLEADLLAMTPVKLRMWCRKNGHEYDKENPQEDTVENIINAVYEATIGGEDEDIPF
jgi:hypothetical protein